MSIICWKEHLLAETVQQVETDAYFLIQMVIIFNGFWFVQLIYSVFIYFVRKLGHGSRKTTDSEAFFSSCKLAGLLDFLSIWKKIFSECLSVFK